MLVATGSVLVLLTWALCLGALIVLGLPVAALTRRGPLGLADLRRGLWWGLLVVTVLSYAGNLIWPLASGAMAGVVGLVVVAAGAVSWVLVRRRGWRASVCMGPWVGVLAMGLGAAVVYLAVAALGPVTNYDSGLYHLGAIRYAAEYATIPGLANLYFPFGYGNAEFPLAALLGNGPWELEGYRLLNGLVIAGVCLDLLLRALGGRRSPGLLVLMVGAVTLLVPMVALSDYWVTSPSQDSAVFAATVAASAYLADAVRGSRAWVADAAVAGAIGVLLVLFRPTMAAYLLAVLVVVVALRMRRGAGASPRFSAGASAVLIAGAAAAAVAAARDYVLSGWLQYPLSIWAFDVPWRAPDPMPERVATLGYHRDPTSIYEAAEGWGWILPWIGRLPEQWETWVIVVLLVAIAIGVGVARTQHVLLRWRPMLVATIPSVAMTAAWWLASPPSFRFAWGPVLTSLTVPLGWILWRVLRGGSEQEQRRWLTLVASGASLVIIGVVGVSAALRLDVGSMTQERTWALGVRIPYVVTPVAEKRMAPVVLSETLTVLVPQQSEQCWSTWPLCTPRPPYGMTLDTGELQRGFIPADLPGT